MRDDAPGFHLSRLPESQRCSGRSPLRKHGGLSKASAAPVAQLPDDAILHPDQLADDGIAVCVISSYLPEILTLSDRILIARQGKIVEEMDRRVATEEAIMYAAVH